MELGPSAVKAQYPNHWTIREFPKSPGLEDNFFFLINLLMYLFLAALGLCCCTRALSSCGKWGHSVTECGLLIAVASLAAEHGL